MSALDELNKAKADLAEGERLQQLMKEVNKIIKSNPVNMREKLVDLGLTSDRVDKILTPDYRGRLGFPSYRLINNNANNTRLKKRVLELEAKVKSAKSNKEESYVFEGGKIDVNYDADRVQIRFNAIPDAETRTKLKGSGWNWSPTNQAWQRKITQAAKYDAMRITGAKPSETNTPVQALPEKIYSEQDIKDRRFTYVSITGYDLFDKNFEANKRLTSSLVVFSPIREEVLNTVREYFKKHLPEIDQSKVKVNTYPKTYVEKAKALFRNGMYLPNPGDPATILKPFYNEAKKLIQLQKGIEVEQEHKETLEKLQSGKITIKEAIKETAKEHIKENEEYYDQLPEENSFLNEELTKYKLTIPEIVYLRIVWGFKAPFRSDKYIHNKIDLEKVRASLAKKGYVTNGTFAITNEGKKAITEIRKEFGADIGYTDTYYRNKNVIEEQRKAYEKIKATEKDSTTKVTPELKTTKAQEIANSIKETIDKGGTETVITFNNNNHTAQINVWYGIKIIVDDEKSPIAAGILIVSPWKKEEYNLAEKDKAVLTVLKWIDQAKKEEQSGQPKGFQSGETVNPNTGEEFDNAVMNKIEPHDSWVGNDIKERHVKGQIYEQLSGPESERVAETERIFNIYRERQLFKDDKIKESDLKHNVTNEYHGVNHNYKNQYALNKAIEALIQQKGPSPEDYSSDEKAFVRKYSGYGGLDKYGPTGKGGLFEYYTPVDVVKKMWALAFKHGYNNGSILEPSCGTGEFLQFAKPESLVVGYEINQYSAKIAKILYPNAVIHHMPFEEAFIQRNYTVKDKTDHLEKFDLAIGNPPYGDFSIVASRFMTGMGEKDHTKAKNYVEYFLRRSVDLLNPGGLLIFIVGAQVMNGGVLFLDGGPSPVKMYLEEYTELLEAYRLPDSIFERTGVTSEIIVLRKK